MQGSVDEKEHNISTIQDESSKVERIQRAKDLDALRHEAMTEGGLINDELRRIAWPILLGCHHFPDDSGADWKELPQHSDEDQVRLDVDRSFVYYPQDENDEKRDARRQDLSRVITAVLRRHSVLHYFQGYHDIVQVFLLVLGVEAAVPAVSRLSLLRIRDFMLPTMSGTEPHLQLLPAILRAADLTLAKHLSHTQPFFALPATLTLYAHVIEEYGSIARLFDFLLASDAASSVYLFAAVVLSRKEELLEIEADEPEMLHAILSKLPQPLDLEGLIKRSVDLYNKHPPESLPGRTWSRISTSSVLKTTRDFESLSRQTLEDGERFFKQEAEEIRRRDAFLQKKQQLQAIARRYRRPAIYTSAAVLVAFVAMLFRGSNSPIFIQGSNPIWLGLQQRVAEMWHHFSR